MTLAYRAISRRERTVAEVRAFLERKEIEEADIEYALGELLEAGALDDERFARLLAEDKRSIDGWGGARIDRELRRRGVPDHLAEAERAVRPRRRAPRRRGAAGREVPPAEDDRGRDKAWRMLVRKGYEPELAYDAVRRAQCLTAGVDLRVAACLVEHE